MTTNNKIKVFNSIECLNTVGEELEEVLDAHDRNKSDFIQYMNWEGKKLSEIKKINKKDLNNITSFFGIDGIDRYLESFQLNYHQDKVKLDAQFKKNKMLFNKLEGVLPLLRDEFNEGTDLLEDILDFLDAYDEDQINKKVENTMALYKSNR